MLIVNRAKICSPAARNIEKCALAMARLLQELPKVHLALRISHPKLKFLSSKNPPHLKMHQMRGHDVHIERS